MHTHNLSSPKDNKKHIEFQFQTRINEMKKKKKRSKNWKQTKTHTCHVNRLVENLITLVLPQLCQHIFTRHHHWAQTRNRRWRIRIRVWNRILQSQAPFLPLRFLWQNRSCSGTTTTTVVVMWGPVRSEGIWWSPSSHWSNLFSQSLFLSLSLSLSNRNQSKPMFLNFWVCGLWFGSVFLLFLFKTNLDHNSCDFLF